MNKLILPLLIILSFVFTSNANATLIQTPLTVDNYITYKNLDWAWASPVNAENWYSFNTLMAPETHEGWRFATTQELIVLKNELTLLDFTKKDNLGNIVYNQGEIVYIHAVEYWNTYFSNVTDFDNLLNIQKGQVASMWQNSADDDYAGYDTFYVRDIPTNGLKDNNTTSVPEPASLAILAFGLIFLSLKRIFTNKAN